tara:strand:+ start:3266 stop:3583 length:318 start_codon:yes stop_codon:yes gene_type:complete
MKKLNKRTLIEEKKKSDPVLRGTTCFKVHKDSGVACQKTSCRYWQKMEDDRFSNCVIIAAQKGPMTLQEVGNIFGVTRMRICQIEKAAKQFLKSSPSKIIKEIKS